MGEVEGSEKWRRLLPEKLISRGKGTVHRLLAQVQTSLPCDENRERGEEGGKSRVTLFSESGPPFPLPPFSIPPRLFPFCYTRWITSVETDIFREENLAGRGRGREAGRMRNDHNSAYRFSPLRDSRQEV